MADLPVPSAQPIAHLSGVQLMRTGTWVLASGTTTFTADDLRSAVAALDCPSVRRPQLKLGHTDPRFDGEPAVGWVDNMATSDDGATLTGDYVGMPGWLGDVIASAYPDRSVEGCWDYPCGQGHVHPFVITAVALLGVTAPGITTLASLQDVATLYGVAAAAAPIPGSFTIPTASEATVPNPTPRKVAAAATTEDVRRAFYEDADWDMWIEEIQLDPLQIIVVSDEDGERSRVPVVIDAAKDGEDAVSFGPAVPVVIRYEDVPGEDAGEVAAKALAMQTKDRVVFASRAESRPGAKPVKAANIDNNVKCATCTHLASAHADIAAGDNTGACTMANCDCKAMKVPATAAAPPQEPPAEPVETNPPKEGADMSDTLTLGLRERLGIKADVELDEAGVLAALDEALAEQVKEPVAASKPPEIPEGKVLISTDVLDELKISAKAGAEARAQQLAEARDKIIASAVKDGKIAPARRQFWATKWDKDPEGAKADLDSIEKGLIPVAATGYTGGAEGDGDEVLYSSLFADEKVGA
jgi:hypothetical protein